MGESEEKSMSDANGGGGRSIARPRTDRDKLCYTVPEAAEMLSLSRNFAYELVKQKKLPAVKFGKT
jgi:excisionase family DNA binding protein